MGSFDTYCMICGGQPHVNAREALEDQVECIWGDGEYDWPEDCTLPVDPSDFTPVIFENEDVVFQTYGAVVGPFENGVPMIEVHDIPTEDLLLIPTDKIAVLCGMNDEDYGVLKNSDGTFHLGVGDSRTYFFLHETCLRFIEPFSRFTIHTLWDLYRRTDTEPYATRPTLMKGIKYLEIERSIGQFIDPWFALDASFQPLFRAIQHSPDPSSALQNLFLNNAEMWVFVAPDQFPLQEAFTHQLSSFPKRPSGHHTNLPSLSTLPLELQGQIISILCASDTLSLLATSNIVRTILLPVVDVYAKQDIHRNHPWMLTYGSSETVEWNDQVMFLADQKQPVPWFVYRSVCKRRSYSMRNRRRIWKILKQMEALGEDKGIF